MPTKEELELLGLKPIARYPYADYKGATVTVVTSGGVVDAGGINFLGDALPEGTTVPFSDPVLAKRYNSPVLIGTRSLPTAIAFSLASAPAVMCFNFRIWVEMEQTDGCKLYFGIPGVTNPDEYGNVASIDVAAAGTRSNRLIVQDEPITSGSTRTFYLQLYVPPGTAEGEWGCPSDRTPPQELLDVLDPVNAGDVPDEEAEPWPPEYTPNMLYFQYSEI